VALLRNPEETGDENSSLQSNVNIATIAAALHQSNKAGICPSHDIRSSSLISELAKGISKILLAGRR